MSSTRAFCELRPDLDDRWEETVRPAWPEFLRHDKDHVLCVANTLPFYWDRDRARGLADLVAPVRPSWKSRYPLTPMSSYAK